MTHVFAVDQLKTESTISPDSALSCRIYPRNTDTGVWPPAARRAIVLVRPHLLRALVGC